jgi:hypothetical protein
MNARGTYRKVFLETTGEHIFIVVPACEIPVSRTRCSALGGAPQSRDPYVDDPRAARVFSGLIGSLASICPAC